MLSTLALSIGVGLVVSLIFTELFGLAAGGMVVPGYIALSLHRPADLAATFTAGFATFAVVHALSQVTIIYGRRRTVLMVLLGYILGAVVRTGLHDVGPATDGVEVIGHIVPGLIALWLDRQGVVETLAALVTASVVVRLILIVLVGHDLGAL